MEYYRRHLPHIHPEQETFFITFRLHNSLPHWIIRTLQEDREAHKAMLLNGPLDRGEYHRRYFEQFDKFLDAQRNHHCWLSNPVIASIVDEALLFRDGTKYDLISYCIMPNHVHLLVVITDRHERSGNERYTYLSNVLQSLKSYTATECNQKLHRHGQFWQRESYDRVIRDQNELERTIHYIVNNPVAAGMVKNRQEWKFTYCCYDL